MIKWDELIATWFYSGRLKPASGTWGTIASLPLCYALINVGILPFFIIFFVIFIVGYVAINTYERRTGIHDASHIVIDETAGMLLASLPLFILPQTWWLWILCFVLFRLFDAVKKGPVGWLDKNIDGALGVMIDDIAAGLLTTITVLLGYVLWTL